jgi:hypothetical protein
MATPLAPLTGGPIYFVLSDYGPKVGKAYHETDPENADRDTVLSLLTRGQFSRVVGILEVDLAAGSARDVSAQFACEILRIAQPEDLPADVAIFATLRANSQ